MMLTHPTLEKLQALRLNGMLKALNEQQQRPEIESLGFEERLGLLIDLERLQPGIAAHPVFDVNHGHPLAQFVKIANTFACDIRVEKDDDEVDGKSILGLMMLAAGHGSVISVSTD